MLCGTSRLVACLQEREAFLQQFRFTGSTEDFEVAMRAYEWPRKFAGNLREASGKANTGKGCCWQAANASCNRTCLCLRISSALLIVPASCKFDGSPILPLALSKVL